MRTQVEQQTLDQRVAGSSSARIQKIKSKQKQVLPVISGITFSYSNRTVTSRRSTQF